MKLLAVIVGVLIIVGIASGCRGQTPDVSPALTEASGIARYGNQLLIVSDDQPGTVFIFDLPESNSGIVPLVGAPRRIVRFEACELASDLEGIDLLADGRVVVLSEDLHALLAARLDDTAACQLVAQFDASLTELAGRGLEGVAVKRLPDGASRVAVSWEGGYLSRSALPQELVARIGDFPVSPEIVVTEIAASGSAGYIDKPLARFSPRIPTDTLPPPYAQRFRCPDLVWHTWNVDSGRVDGLILLLTSQNSPPSSAPDQQRYEHKMIVRCDLAGKLHGQPLDLSAAASAILENFLKNGLSKIKSEQQQQVLRFKRLVSDGNWENVNWEGLSWFEPGISLIATYDGVPFDPPLAFIIPLPEGWR